MKKVIKSIKNNILGFIIGAVIFTGVGVSAATYLYNSSQISYSNSNSSATDVKGAIDELYTLTNVGNATSGDISSGKTALVQGELITGTGATSGIYLSDFYTSSNGYNNGNSGTGGFTLDISKYNTLKVGNITYYNPSNYIQLKWSAYAVYDNTTTIQLDSNSSYDISSYSTLKIYGQHSCASETSGTSKSGTIISYISIS